MTILMTHLTSSVVLRNQVLFFVAFQLFYSVTGTVGISKQHAFILSSLTHDSRWCRLKIKIHAMKTVLLQKPTSVVYIFVQTGNIIYWAGK